MNIYDQLVFMCASCWCSSGVSADWTGESAFSSGPSSGQLPQTGGRDPPAALQQTRGQVCARSPFWLKHTSLKKLKVCTMCISLSCYCLCKLRMSVLECWFILKNVRFLRRVKLKEFRTRPEQYSAKACFSLDFLRTRAFPDFYYMCSVRINSSFI